MRHRLLPAHRRAGSLRHAALVIAVLALAACATPPPTHFHTLMPSEIAPRAGTQPASGIAVVVEPVRLPAQVDQPQWLVLLADDSLALLEQERWASPLRDEFRQALLEELVVGQGIVDARTQPAAASPSSPSLSPSPSRLAIDVRRFDSLPGREARIEGSWAISGGDPRSVSSRCEWLIRESAPGSFPALAAAHRRAVARLGAAIGPALARARRGEATACPAFDPPR